jgi:ATP-dependent Clp protease ATP-binding subunit ClpX
MAQDTKIKCGFCESEIREKDGIIHRNESGDAVVICQNCIRTAAQAMGIINKKNIEAANKEADKNDSSVETTLLSPREIYTYLKQHVIGQDEYLKALSMFGHHHTARIQRISAGDNFESAPQKQNLFVVGPSGSGKTFAANLLCTFLNVPFYIGDVTGLTQTGFVGADVLDLIRVLVQKTKGEWQHGILVLDEIDKCRTRTTRQGDRDVNGQGVQETLLKIIEGMELEIPPWIEGKSSRRNSESVIVDTRTISVVACGAYTDVGFGRRTKSETTIGFRRGIEQSQTHRKIETDEIIDALHKTGMLHEFLGRFNKFVILDELDVESLERILYSPASSLINKEKERFASQGFSLEVDDSALQHIAVHAHKKGLGARGLRMVLTEILDTVAFECFGTGKTGTVTVYAEEDRLQTKVMLDKGMKRIESADTPCERACQQAHI